jgi:hypothetical protein
MSHTKVLLLVSALAFFNTPQSIAMDPYSSQSLILPLSSVIKPIVPVIVNPTINELKSLATKLDKWDSSKDGKVNSISHALNLEMELKKKFPRGTQERKQISTLMTAVRAHISNLKQEDQKLLADKFLGLEKCQTDGDEKTNYDGQFKVTDEIRKSQVDKFNALQLSRINTNSELQKVRASIFALKKYENELIQDREKNTEEHKNVASMILALHQIEIGDQKYYKNYQEQLTGEIQTIENDIKSLGTTSKEKSDELKLKLIEKKKALASVDWDLERMKRRFDKTPHDKSALNQGPSDELPDVPSVSYTQWLSGWLPSWLKAQDEKTQLKK